MSDPQRKVNQLDADVHEIYGLLRGLDANVRDIGARVLRQEGRLNQIESDLQGLAEGQQVIRADVTDVKANVAEILALLRPPTAD